MMGKLLIPCSAVLALAGLARAEGPILVDHRHVAWFERIPPAYRDAARDLRLLFSDRSVGQNLNESLDCLAAPSWAQSPAGCRRDYTDADWHWRTFTATDWAAGLVPARIRFEPDPVLYDRSNWTFEYRSGQWYELTQEFITSLAPAYHASKDVLSYQFSYLNVTVGDSIADPLQGFFADHPTRYDIHDLEAFIAQHPDKVFVFFTTSLARGIGTAEATAFNDQLRAYCRAHGHVLFDFADIESRTPDGLPCVDNRDGVPYVAQTGASEDYPDDGMAYPAICQDYTTETDGGHLGSVSAGRIRLAKALWVLMARVAGWEPYGDLDSDGDVDLEDYALLAGCLTGPGGSAAPACAGYSADGDSDLDLADLAAFQRSW